MDDFIQNCLNLSTSHGLDLTTNYGNQVLNLTRGSHHAGPTGQQGQQSTQHHGHQQPNQFHNEVGLNLSLQSGMNLTRQSNQGYPSNVSQPSSDNSGYFYNQEFMNYSYGSDGDQHQHRNSPLNLERRSSPLNLTSVQQPQRTRGNATATVSTFSNGKSVGNHQQQYYTDGRQQGFVFQDSSKQQGTQQMGNHQQNSFGNTVQMVCDANGYQQANYSQNGYYDHSQMYQQQQNNSQVFNNMGMGCYDYSNNNQSSSSSSLKPIRLFCSDCCQEFQNTVDLNRHMARHNQQAVSNGFSCQSCVVTFQNQGYLMNHNKKYHSAPEKAITNQSQGNWSTPCTNTYQTFGNGQGNGDFVPHAENYSMSNKDGMNSTHQQQCNMVQNLTLNQPNPSTTYQQNTLPPNLYSHQGQFMNNSQIQQQQNIQPTMPPPSQHQSLNEAQRYSTVFHSKTKSNQPIGISESQPVISSETKSCPEKNVPDANQNTTGTVSTSKSKTETSPSKSTPPNSSLVNEASDCEKSNPVPESHLRKPPTTNNNVEQSNNSANKTNELPERCAECRMTFPNGVDLRKHMDLVHKGRQGTMSFQCLVCAKLFEDRASHKKHLQVHAKDKPVKCDICGLRVRSQIILKKHQLRKHNEKSRPFECSDCGKRFFERHELQRHQKVHESPKCDKCGKILSTKKLRDSHSCKEKSTEFECKICGAFLESKTGWGFHMWRHTKDPSYITTPNSTSINLPKSKENCAKESTSQTKSEVSMKQMKKIEGPKAKRASFVKIEDCQMTPMPPEAHATSYSQISQPLCLQTSGFVPEEPPKPLNMQVKSPTKMDLET